MNWSILAAVLVLSCPVAARSLTYFVSGSIDQIDPGVASGAGPPSGFGVGDRFRFQATFDSSTPPIILAPGIFQLEARLALRVGESSLDAPDQSILITVDCSFSVPCDFYLERTTASGPMVPFDDSWIGQVGFAASFASELISGTGIGEPLVPNGQPGSFFLGACQSSTSCLVDYTALGTVDSIRIAQNVPAIGPVGLVSLFGLIGLAARLAGKAG